MNIYPLSYCIPEEYFNNNSLKNKLIANLIPGDLTTYIYDKEDDYFKMYRESKYAITKKKYGWDCLRHYEILASNCIPLFNDLINCPKNTMFNFPKKLLIEINDKFNKKEINDSEYKYYSNKIYQYSLKNLTCKKNAKYLIEKMMLGMEKKDLNKIKILMISGQSGYRNVNYSRELLSIGLRRVLGYRFIDYPKLKVLYKGCKKYKCIGKGFTYTDKFTDNINRENILRRIKNKEFDFIIYGRVGNKDGSEQKLKQLKFWDHVFDNYSKERIAFIYGGDFCRSQDNKDLENHSKFGNCFVRELN